MAKGIRIMAALIAICVALVAVESQAFTKGRNVRGFKKETKDTFSATGKFIGAIDHRITVDGKDIVLTDKTSIYVVGAGYKKNGIFVTSGSVYVGGVVKKGVFVANYVVVRPANADANAAPVKKSRYWIQSTSNPKVGKLTEDFAG